MNEERIVIYEDDLNETIALNEKIEQIEPKLETLTVTPSNEEQQFESSLDGYSKVTVQGDEDLIAENIKEGIEIFGVTGNAKVSNAKITDARYLFYGGARIDYINELLAICENVTNAGSMFYNCAKLTSLDLSNFNTSNVTNMSYMFYLCEKLTNLTLSNFDTSNVTEVQHMFRGCTKLTSLDLSNFDTSNVTDMSNMFNGCESLTDLDLSNFDTSNVKGSGMGSMFIGCKNLINLDLSSFDASKVSTSTSQIFQRCTNLTNLKSFKNIGKGYTSTSANSSTLQIDFSDCTLLTHESLMSVIDNLYDLASDGKARQILVLGATNLAKLTADEIAIATNKGWNVS